jgi:hypothetical protein
MEEACLRLSAGGAGQGKRLSTARESCHVDQPGKSCGKIFGRQKALRRDQEYRSTVTKWLTWGQGVDVDQIERHHIRDFLDWVHDKATNDRGSNAGRTANKARENLRAIMSWAWEQDYTCRNCLDFRNPSHNAMWLADTT